MHYTRIVGLVGVAISAIGLFLQSASSGAEAAIPDAGGATFLQAANAGNPAVPAEFLTVWGTIRDESLAGALVLALALLIVVALAFVPPIKHGLGRIYALVLTIDGVILIVIAGIATNAALSDASDLQNGFAQGAAAGLLPEVYGTFGVSISVGWVLLLVGGGVAAVAGILSLMADTDAQEAAADEMSE